MDNWSMHNAGFLVIVWNSDTDVIKKELKETIKSQQE